MLAKPTKGSLVQSLDLPSTASADNIAAFASEIRRLFLLLPNLVTLHIHSLPTLHDSNNTPLISSSALARLESLEVSLDDREEEGIVDLDSLAQFGGLPLLRRLRLRNWAGYLDDELRRSDTTLLPSVTRLEVQGSGADVQNLKFLLVTCPSVLYLELESEHEEGPEFATRLPPLPSTLQSLHLHGTYRAQVPVDSILPRLNQLRHLHLGEGLYSRNIFTVLQQLPLLTELHLDHGTLYPVPLQSLLAGPSRLASLQRVTLEFDKGPTGSRIPKPSTVASDYSFSFESGFSRHGIIMGDWDLPGEGSDDILNVIDLRRMKSIAEDNGLTLSGNLESTVKMITDYHIEANNRATVTAYRQGDLDILGHVRNAAVRDGIALPPLDLDSLDLERLEIVEIDLPEREWFMLNLRNKE